MGFVGTAGVFFAILAGIGGLIAGLVIFRGTSGKDEYLPGVSGIPNEMHRRALEEGRALAALEIARQIDLEDTSAVTQFGVGAQKKIADFADTVLAEIRAKDAGYVGETLTNLVVNIKDMGVNKITVSLEEARKNLLKDITLLDKLYGKNEEYLGDLDLFIAAGQLKLEEDLKAKLRDVRG